MLLSCCIVQKELNWKNVLMCIACGLQLQPLFQGFMTGMLARSCFEVLFHLVYVDILQELVETGLSSSDRDVLCAALVLARHNGDDQPHEKYKTWFTVGPL